MGANAVFTKWFPNGFRLLNGLTINNWFNYPQTSYEDKITATAGGTQAKAYQLTAVVSRLSTVATAADSVQLPPSTQWIGGQRVVINDGVANADVYPSALAASDQIDAAGLATAVVITAGKRTIFFCSSAGVITSLEGSKTT